MIYILDKDERIQGVLSNKGNGCRYVSDLHNNKIAEAGESDNGQLNKIWSESLSLSVPYNGKDEIEMLENGTELLIQDKASKLWKLFTIYEVSDDVVGQTHYKNIEAFNSCIWKLAHTQIETKTFTNAKSSQIFPYIFQRSGWTLNPFNEFDAPVNTIAIEAGTSQAALDNAIKEFKVEVEAYAEINKDNSIKRCVRLVSKLGEKTGELFEYRHNIKGASRKRLDADFYTKLFVYGVADDKGNPSTITSVNKVKNSAGVVTNLPYIVDDEANDKYNDGKAYIEGAITSETLSKPAELLAWGKEQMKYYNHPKYQYSVDVSLLGERPNIGDTVPVVDFEMLPPMAFTARVVETNFSTSDPKADSVVFGEFTTIKVVPPNLIKQLEAKADQALKEIGDIKDYRITYTTPDGTDFADTKEKKRIVVQVFKGLIQVTSELPADAFEWERIDRLGNFDLTFQEVHKGSGNVIAIDYLEAGTIRCNVSLPEKPEKPDEEEPPKPIRLTIEADFSHFSRFQFGATATDPEINYKVCQYAHYDVTSNQIYWSQKYEGAQVTKEDIALCESYSLSRTDVAGNLLDKMVIKYGGHGSHYGVENVNGKVWIYSALWDKPNKKWYYVKFPYTPNKVLLFGDPIVKVIANEKDYSYGRFNLDTRNGYVLFVAGQREKATHRIVTREDFEKNKLDVKYSMKASDIGIKSTQTYQSSCLDFPYLYTTYGYGYGNGEDDSKDRPTTYCIDVRTKALVYKIDFAFNAGIRPLDDLHEAETINYYYDKDGVKWMLQGFATRHENPNYARANNSLYKAKEYKRADT
ncbi:hypothetical protein A374_08704 [Fictibacillus macauensis ZFHKF-1]|uniref:Uncharacterized protein n=1 Tax=Fictibacillus macauensis ZFHKF-1 TaxID=1196324 RepID=I8AJD6_9BACL|nr:phage tail spike protein [Fictibacillus macauensis]EIT85902.1 hypothetical protein A374_08704 [Fictibacillus macauensis ZFHKF-1]